MIKVQRGTRDGRQAAHERTVLSAEEYKGGRGYSAFQRAYPRRQAPLTFYHEITSQHAKVKDVPPFLDDDLFFISNDLVHFTSLLFLLRPFINNAMQEAGTYQQNWYDARYLSYASVLYSAVYNFWDRIGDLLHCFFATRLPAKKVYFVARNGGWTQEIRFRRTKGTWATAFRVTRNSKVLNEQNSELLSKDDILYRTLF
jgi:hypothetical protein